MAAEIRIVITEQGGGGAIQQAAKDVDDLGKTAKDAGGGFSALKEIGVGALREIGALAVNALGTAAGAVKDFIAGGIDAARETAKLNAQTDAVLKSTGNAAGTTAQHIQEYASALSDAAGKSLFGDDQIQQSENMLLTFTNIKGATLDAATAISVDMAQALGGAPKDQAIALGKALNDPIKGVTALTRVGVTFSQEQKDMIQAMVDTGDVAGAQAVILAELNKEFGGSAEAAAKADGGMAQFQARMGEAAESLGTALLPLLTSFAGFLNDTVAPAVEGMVTAFSGWLNNPATQAGIQAIVDAVQNGLTVAFQFLTGTVIPALVGAWNAMQPAIETVGSYIQTNIVPIFTNLGTALFPLVGAAVQILAGFWNDVLQPALMTAWNIITTFVVPVLALVAQWLSQLLPPAIRTVADFLTGTLFPALHTVYDFINANVVPILGTLVVWLRDNVPPAAQKVADFWNSTLKPALEAVWAFIKDSVIPIITSLVTSTFSTLNSAVQTVSDLWTGTLKPALSAVWDFLNTYVIPLFTALANLFDAVVGLAVKVLAGLWKTVLLPALTAVWDYITKNVNPIFDTVGTKMGDVSTVISATLGPAFTWLKDNVLGPVAESFGYISTAIQTVIGWLNDMAAKINSIKIPDWLEGHSPPPMADWFGYIAAGVQGVADALPGLNTTLNSSAGLISTVVSGLQDTIAFAAQAKQALQDARDKAFGDAFGRGTPGDFGGGFGLPGLAAGTNFFNGGAAIVGENGPELVVLPRGATVMSSADTRRLIANTYSRTVNINYNNVANAPALDYTTAQALGGIG